MRAFVLALALAIALAATPIRAHGPQIQITVDDSKIVTRQIVLEEPYSTVLTPPTTVYVIPLRETNGVWYARPNNLVDPILGTPAYVSGPGFAYGSDRVDGGPQVFAEGSVLSVDMLGGLKTWDGSTFVDSQSVALKAFRGSDPAITSPPENYAVTSDSGPYDDLSLAPIGANYAPDAHSSLRFALLGDGTSPTSVSPNGVYLAGMSITSTQAPLFSDPYYFVLHKNAPLSEIVAAVQSLDVAPSMIQWIVPEPSCAALAAICVLCVARSRRALWRKKNG